VEVEVLVFASYREVVGRKSLTLQLPLNATVRDAAHRLEADYPALSLKGALAAINERYAAPEAALEQGDTLAFFPPVSGGTDADLFLVTERVLDLAGLVSSVSAPAYGAVATFVGTVRSPNAGVIVAYIDYEGYEGMIQTQMCLIANEARARNALGRIALAHRLGRLGPGEASIMIAVSSAHRREALSACRYLIDRSKELLPVWKYEVAEGSEGGWVKGVSTASKPL
jgi:MoaE-MoaD fusion protein